MLEDHKSEVKTDIKLLLECLKCQLDNPTALKQALITVATIAASDGNIKDFIRESGGLSFIFSLLSKSSNCEVIQSALYCTGCCIEGNVFSQKFLTDVRVFSLIHDIFVSRTTTNSLKNTATFFLLCLVANNGHGQTLAKQTSCMEDLLDIFRKTFIDVKLADYHHKKTEIELWCNVVSALCMCVNNPQNVDNQQACIVVLPVSLKILQDCMEEKVFCSLTSLLGMVVSNNTFNQDRVRTCGGLEIFLSCLIKLTASPEEKDIHLAVNLTGTIDLCTSENRENCERLTELDSLSYFIQLLRSGCLNQQEKLQVVLTVGHFIDLIDLNQKKMHESDGLTVLIHLLTEAVDDELITALKYVLQICTPPVAAEKHQESQKTETVNDKRQRFENLEILEKIQELEQKLQDLERTEMNNTNTSLASMISDKLPTGHQKRTSTEYQSHISNSDTIGKPLARQNGQSESKIQSNYNENNCLISLTEKTIDDEGSKIKMFPELSEDTDTLITSQHQVKSIHSVPYLDIVRCENNVFKATNQTSNSQSKALTTFDINASKYHGPLCNQSLPMNQTEDGQCLGQQTDKLLFMPELQEASRENKQKIMNNSLEKLRSPLETSGYPGSSGRLQTGMRLHRKITNTPSKMISKQACTVELNENQRMLSTSSGTEKPFVCDSQESTCLDITEKCETENSSTALNKQDMEEVSNTHGLKGENIVFSNGSTPSQHKTNDKVVSGKLNSTLHDEQAIFKVKKTSGDGIEYSKENSGKKNNFLIPRIPVKKKCTSKENSKKAAGCKYRMTPKKSVNINPEYPKHDLDTSCLKVIPIKSNINDVSLNESCISVFDSELLEVAKSTRHFSENVQPRTSTPVPNFKEKYLKNTGRINLQQNSHSQSPINSDCRSSDTDSAEEDRDFSSSSPDVQIIKNKNCPGCHPPSVLNGPLLNSRTFNIAIETNGGTCHYHREIRRVERKWMQEAKKKLPVKCKKIMANVNVKHGISVVRKESDTYDFLTSSSSEEGRLSPTRESEFEPTPVTTMKQFCGKENANVPQRMRRHRKPYSEEEVEMLQEAVDKMGTRWNQILCTYKFHPSRTAVDLKEKFKRLQRDMKNSSIGSKVRECRKKFSMCEERRLRKGVRRYGFNWTLILNSYKFQLGRTGDDLRSKLRNMSKRPHTYEE